MDKHGMNMIQVKRNNRSTVINCINNAQAISRKDIAEKTGLTAAAVTLICNEFIDKGILYEGESVKKEAGTGAGRRKVLVSINYDVFFFVAITIESDRTHVAVTNIRGDIEAEATIETDKTVPPQDFLEKIANEVKKLKEKLPSEKRKKICCCAVSVPGTVDIENGISVHAIGLWETEVNIKSFLTKKIGMPVYVDNNVNCFARAEEYFDTGREHDNFLIIKWGPGIGAANIVNNSLPQSFHGKCAEIGHSIVQKNGKQCVCGRKGCLETFASEAALMNGSEEEVDNAIELFALTIVNLCTVLYPDSIILVGKLAKNDVYRNKLIESIKKYSSNSEEKIIRYTNLADREFYIGTVALAAECSIMNAED